MARSTFRDLCISALRTSQCVGLSEVPDQGEINLALEQLNGLMETLFLEETITPYDSTIQAQTDSNGAMYFGSTLDPLITPVSNQIPSSIAKVVDSVGQRELMYLNESDFAIQISKSYGADIPYFTYGFEEPRLVKLQSSNSTKTLYVKFKATWQAVALDDNFNLPMHYWGMIEYGLATILAGWFGKENVDSLNAIYLSRKGRIESMNFEPNVLGAHKSVSNFENGYGLL